MTGPKAPATRSVPRDWKEKSPTAITAAIRIRISRPKVFQPRDEQHPLDGGQEGDGGGDDAVAQKQRDADEGEETGEGELPAGFDRLAQDLPQHDLPALPLVGKAHGQPGILRGHEDQHRPDDEGKDAQDAGLRPRRQGEHDRQGVDGARADVAEHDPHRADDADPERFLFACFQNDPRKKIIVLLSPKNRVVKLGEWRSNGLL